MRVINLFAPPGTGKTATGQILSGLLSIANYKVEYIPEFAKFATLSKNDAALQDQVYMFGKQENRLNVLNKADLDFVVMDGPLPLALLFHPDKHYRNFEPLVMEVFKDFDNINVYLKRGPSHVYKTHGRNETSEEALQLDSDLRDILRRHEVPFREFTVDERLPFTLFEYAIGKPAPLTTKILYGGAVPLDDYLGSE
jgi:hypothetical protein